MSLWKPRWVTDDLWLGVHMTAGVIDYRPDSKFFCHPFVVAVTLVKVKKGEEALLDYGSSYFPDLITSVCVPLMWLLGLLDSGP